MEGPGTRDKPTDLRVLLGATANTNSLQPGINLPFPVWHCPPPAAVPSLQGHTVDKPSPGCTSTLHMLHFNCTSLPTHRESRGAEVKSSPFKVLGVFRLNSNAKFFCIIPGHFFILLSAILFVPALPQMHKFCERRKNVYSLWRLLKNQKRK